MKRLFTYAAVVLSFLQADAQILNEPFNYTSGDTLSAIGWTQIAAVITNPIRVTSPGLNISGYKSNGADNATSLTTTGQDVYKDASSSITSGSLYASTLINVTAAQSAGDYFLTLLPAGSTTSFTSRLFVKLSSTGYFKIGISKFSVGVNEAASYSTDSFTFNTTYAVVMKYQFNTGSTTDDTVKVFVFNNSFPATEPATITTQSIMINPVADAANLSRIAIRQGSAANAPSLKLDGILMGTSWTDLVSSSVAPPSPVNALTLTGTTKTTADVSWTYPTLYIDTTTTILVFAKKDTAIITGTPTLSNGTYTAGSDLTNPGTAYEHDPAAFCVYKGDAAGFVLSGLQTGASYHLLSYIVTDVDSVYSTAATANGMSSPKPASVTSTLFTSGGQTTAQITWTKPADYADANYTTLVFVKPDTATSGPPTQLWAANYTANTDWSGVSSSLDNDPTAHCVLNGDAASVSITGLAASTTYYVSIYTFREADSTYSDEGTTGGSTDGLIPNPKPVNTLVVDSIGYDDVSLTWTKDIDYVDSAFSVLVFAKFGSPVNAGLNTAPSSAYNASIAFGAGSPYENDSNAFCMYNGDGTGASVINLQDLSNYHFLIYVVRDTDTTYSTSVDTNITTFEFPPEPVSGITVTGSSQTTARITWIKQGDYTNTRFTTLVFAKAGSINAGTVNKGVSAYTSNPILGSGTPFDADANAFCVYKGDTNFVNITGLSSLTQYDIIVFVMRDLDSVESLEATGSGSTQGPPPMRTIGSINTTNPTTGVADSIGVRVTVKGIVYGFDQRAAGVQFLLKDATGGITLFNATKTFGYTVTEGDEIEAEGVITTFRGLNEITLDTIRFVSSGNTLLAARKVQVVNESAENDLVYVDSVRFVTTPAGGIWPASSSNIQVITPANDTIVLRVLSSSGLSGKNLPSTLTFTIAGMGSQFTTVPTSPFPFNGYQLFPRYEADVTEVAVILPDSLTPFSLLNPLHNNTITVSASTLTDTLEVAWTNSVNTNGLDPVEYTLLLDTLGGDFGNPYLEINNSTDTILPISYTEIISGILDPLQVPIGGTVALSWQVAAVSGNLVRTSTETFTVYIVNDLTIGTPETDLNQQITLSPNPAHGYTRISGVSLKDQVELLDITGRKVWSQSATETSVVIPTIDLNTGVYFVRVQSGNASVTRKLVVQ